MHPQKSSTQQQTFESPHQQAMLTKPNPPTADAIHKAQFVDKTYHWINAGLRSRN